MEKMGIWGFLGFFLVRHPHHLPARSFLCSLESRGGEKGEKKSVRSRKTGAAPKLSASPSPLHHLGRFQASLPALSRLDPAPHPGRIEEFFLPLPSDPNLTGEKQEELPGNRPGCFSHLQQVLEGNPRPSCAPGDIHVVQIQLGRTRGRGTAGLALPPSVATPRKPQSCPRKPQFLPC